MSTQWVEALQSNGLLQAVSSEAAAETIEIDSGEKAQWVDLSSLSVVDVTGEDASAFLQGQFCNDLKSAPVGRAQINGYCTPKGRLLALPTVIGMDNGFRLLVPAEVKETFLKRLTMFIMRSRVTVTERPDWVCCGMLAGSADGTGLINSLLGELPQSVLDVVTSPSRQIIRWHDSTEAQLRYLVLASVQEQIDVLKAALGQASEPLARRSEALWRQGNIRAGIPSITAGVQEAFVPQMINLQLIDGLSFRKGCYPGQEIVARMQYLGKLKRQMRAFRQRLDPATPQSSVPRPGEKLQSLGNDPEAGVVVDAVMNAEGQIELLAVVKVSVPASELLLAGNSLEILELPYALPETLPVIPS